MNIFDYFDYLKDNFKVYTVEECKQFKNEGAYGFVYITQCKVNGKLYIGQKKFRKGFVTYLGSGKLFKRAIDKYGRDNFERIILEVAYSKEELDGFEIKYIELFSASEEDLFYNISLGGSGACLKGEDNPKYKEKVIVKCSCCGKEVEKSEWELKNDKNVFCNKECWRKWQSEQRRGKNSPLYKERVTFKCSCCGIEIERLESHTKNNKNIFCSQQCLAKWQSENFKGKNSSVYKGFVIVYPNGETSKDMSRNEVANYLNVSECTIKKLAREKTCYIGKYERIRYIRVLHLEDYLKEREIYKSDEDFRNMCKRKIEETEILYQNKKEETSKKLSKAGKGREVSEEARRKQSETKKKSLVCIFPNGKIIKNICVIELAEKLKINRNLVGKILKSKQPYKAPIKSNVLSKERLKHLKTLENVRIMYYEDYLKEQSQQDN